MYDEIIKTIQSNNLLENYGAMQIMYVDYVITDTDKSYNINLFDKTPKVGHSTSQVMGLKVFTKKFEKDDLKSTEIFNLYDIILDKYYELFLKNTDDVVKRLSKLDMELDFNQGVSHMGNRKFISKTMILSNYIAAESRRGSGNVAIIPNKKYEFLFPNIYLKPIINPTNIHKDKIFILRVDQESQNPGLTLIFDKGLPLMRHYKLKKLLNKMDYKEVDYNINYILTEIGLNCEKNVMCIYL